MVEIAGARATQAQAQMPWANTCAARCKVGGVSRETGGAYADGGALRSSALLGSAHCTRADASAWLETARGERTDVAAARARAVHGSFRTVHCNELDWRPAQEQVQVAAAYTAFRYNAAIAAAGWLHASTR
jgi:hypothetical protein